MSIFTRNIYDSIMNVKDFSVSKKDFRLVYDQDLEMYKTTPVPDDLETYYHSEDYISHTDGRRSLFEKIYQMVKQYTLSDKERLLCSLVHKKGNLLDIGTGTGDFLAHARKMNWEIVGIEPNAKARELAQKKGVMFVNNTSELSDCCFDVVTMWHVLEHIKDLEHQILELKRICKPGGVLIVAVPNFKSYDAAFYKEFWAAYDVPRHLWHFSKTSIEKLFSDQNIKLEKVVPMYFDSFYVSLLSEKYKTGKMNYIKAFWIGMYSNIRAFFNKEYSSHIYILRNHKKTSLEIQNNDFKTI